MGEHLEEPSMYTMDDDESPSPRGARWGAGELPQCNTPTG